MSRAKDLTGQKFGMLSVMEKTDCTEDQYAVWRCRCDCGNEILVNTRHLTRGTVRNCGCIPKQTARRGPKAEMLAGRQFGELTVIGRAQNRGTRPCWLCRCSCGNQTVVTAHELKAGKTTSCGCRHHLKGCYRSDLTGQRFGRLTALYPTEDRDAKASVYWHCRCDCGKETDVTEDCLVHGNYRSCGCLKKELQQNVHKQLHMMDGTCVELLEFRKSRCDNTSGFRGVYRMANEKYRATIGFKRKRYDLGTYRTLEEAVQARLEAEETIHGGYVEAFHRWKEQEEKGPLIFEVEKVNGTFRVVTNMNDSQFGT